MPRYSLRITLSLTWLALIAACASAPSPVVTTSWRDPSYNGPPFKKIFVVGLSAKSLKDQRGFENLIVYTLQGAGITAVPGWQYVPTDRTPDQAVLHTDDKTEFRYIVGVMDAIDATRRDVSVGAKTQRMPAFSIAFATN